MATENPNSSSTVPPSLREAISGGYPELSAAVLATKDTVSAQHISELRTKIPRARSLDDDSALDDLPEVIDALAKAYAVEEGLAELLMLGPAHASARDGQGFVLEEIFEEYVLFSRSLHRHVVARLGRRLQEREEEAFRGGVDVLLATTMKSFHAQRQARLHLEVTALGHFLSSLAHDLRNEINGVMTSMQALEDGGQRLLHKLQTATDSDAAPAIREVNDLLADVNACHSEMESTVSAMTQLLEAERLRHPVNLHRREVALLPLMNGIVRSAARIDRGSRPDESHAVERIKISCPDDLVLWTDPDLLGTVLVNLIGNAVKHAPHGEILFTAACSADGRCEIAVSDQGPGISEAKLEKLFEKFARGRQASASGLGLGLFIARRATDLLGGKIHAKSTPGHGSCFTLELLPPPAPAHA